MTTLAVIVTNYNKAKYIEKCLDSIIKQTFRASEIIVVDDCSTDSSKEVLFKYKKKYPNLQLVFKEKNEGVSSARNTGLKIANSEYVTTIDADDFYFSRTKLESEMNAVLKARKTKGQMVASFSQTVLVNESDKVIQKLYKKPLGLCVRFGTVTRLYKYQVPRDYCYPKSALIAIGGYDENMNLYEDWDLNLRLLSKMKFVFSGDYGTAYRIMNTGLSSKKTRYHFQAKKMIFEKNDCYLNYTIIEKIVFYFLLLMAYLKGRIKEGNGI